MVSGLLDSLLHLPPAVLLTLVFALPAVEASLFVGVVVPGEIAVLVGGVSAHTGAVSLWAVVLAGCLGAVAGDQVGFLVGRRWGESLLGRLPGWIQRRLDIDRALELIRSRGGVSVVVGRWVAALRALVPGLAGASGMRWGVFSAANVVGGILWASAVAVGGYLAGASYKTLERDFGWAGNAIAVVVVLGVWLVLRRERHARETA